MLRRASQQVQLASTRGNALTTTGGVEICNSLALRRGAAKQAAAATYMMELWDIGCECRVWHHTRPVDVPSLRAGAADGTADEELAELEEREELERVPARP